MPRPIRILQVVDRVGEGGLENGFVNPIENLDPHRFEFEHVSAPGGSRFQVGTLETIREVKPDLMHSRTSAANETERAGKRVGIRGVIHAEPGLEAETAKAGPWRRDCFRRPRLSQPVRRRVREEFLIRAMMRSYRELYEGLTAMAPVRAAWVV